MPRPFYLDVIETLNQSGVRYTIVGGIAAILHGAPRMTGDLDLAVVLDEKNLLTLVEAMISLGYKPRIPADPMDLAKAQVRELWRKEKGMKVFTFFHPKKPFADVDILIDQQVDFNGIWEHRIEYRAGKVRIPTASMDDLIAMKRVSARDKDLSDIAALHRIKALKAKEGNL
jgi:hypothetical protein